MSMITNLTVPRPCSSETSIHSDLLDIDFSLTASETDNIFYEEGTPSGLSKRKCDTANIIPVNEMCIDSLEVTASPCVQVGLHRKLNLVLENNVAYHVQ